MSPDNYDKECVARQLITDLLKAKATGHIQVLLMACALSAKQLDPESYRKFIEHGMSISSEPLKSDLGKFMPPTLPTCPFFRQPDDMDDAPQLTAEPPILSVADINVGAVYDATHAVGEALQPLTANERILVLSECLANESQDLNAGNHKF